MNTNEEHITSMTCPSCGGENINYDGFDARGITRTYQEVFCMDCEYEWDDVYQLIGYISNDRPEREYLPTEAQEREDLVKQHGKSRLIKEITIPAGIKIIELKLTNSDKLDPADLQGFPRFTIRYEEDLK